MRPVMVDRKTAFEDDLLGRLERLDRELPLGGPAGAALGTHRDPTRRQVLRALLDQQLAAPTIAELKSTRMAGEARDGSLAVLVEAASAHDQEAISQENRRRQVIYNGIIHLAPELTAADLPAIRRFFHRKHVESCGPAERIQDEHGRWSHCPRR